MQESLWVCVASWNVLSFPLSSAFFCFLCRRIFSKQTRKVLEPSMPWFFTISKIVFTCFCFWMWGEVTFGLNSDKTSRNSKSQFFGVFCLFYSFVCSLFLLLFTPILFVWLLFTFVYSYFTLLFFVCSFCLTFIYSNVFVLLFYLLFPLLFYFTLFVCSNIFSYFLVLSFFTCFALVFFSFVWPFSLILYILIFVFYSFIYLCLL